MDACFLEEFIAKHFPDNTTGVHMYAWVTGTPFIIENLCHLWDFPAV